MPVENRIVLRMMSLNARFARVGAVEEALRSGLLPSGLDLLAYQNRADRWTKISKGDFPTIFPPKGALHTFRLSTDGGVDAGVHWHVPQVKVRYARFRVDLSIAIGEVYPYEFVDYLFRGLATALEPFWGELVDEVVTTTPTMCPLHGHETTVPHLTQANFFGPDYIEFFGGLDRIRGAGFAKVAVLGEGVYVELPKSATTEEYRAIRSSVESRLAAPEVFDPKIRGPVPRFREHNE